MEPVSEYSARCDWYIPLHGLACLSIFKVSWITKLRHQLKGTTRWFLNWEVFWWITDSMGQLILDLFNLSWIRKPSGLCIAAEDTNTLMTRWLYPTLPCSFNPPLEVKISWSGVCRYCYSAIEGSSFSLAISLCWGIMSLLCCLDAFHLIAQYSATNFGMETKVKTTCSVFW